LEFRQSDSPQQYRWDAGFQPKKSVVPRAIGSKVPYLSHVFPWHMYAKKE